MKKYVLALSVMIAVGFTGCGSIGSGDKIGQVVKINSASGFFCKTVEVEIIRGGFNGGSGVNGSSLHFTVENNPLMVETLEKAMKDGSEMLVNFNHEFVSFCRSDSNSFFGTKVVVLNNQDSNGTLSSSGSSSKKEIINAIILQNKALIQLLDK